MKWFVRYLVRGLAVFVPLALTVWLLWASFQLVDNILPFRTPGLGFAVVLGTILVLGALATHWLTARLLRQLEGALGRVPLVSLLYKSLKDITTALLGETRTFGQPVLVSLVPDSPARAVGFVTRDDLAGWGLPGHVAVYLPQSYNFAGQTLVVPRECVEPLDVPTSEAMTFAVSAGMTGGRDSGGRQPGRRSEGTPSTPAANPPAASPASVLPGTHGTVPPPGVPVATASLESGLSTKSPRRGH